MTFKILLLNAFAERTLKTVELNQYMIQKDDKGGSGEDAETD
jgi:hypothetical protein